MRDGLKYRTRTWMRGRPCALVFFLLILLFLLVASSCGSEESLNVQPDQIDAEPIVEVGATVREEPVLTADDLALDPDTLSIFNANSTRTLADVDFDLEGPWDFREGPESFTLTLATVDKSEAPSPGEFPDATFAVRSSWQPDLVEEQYIFQDLETASWKAFGSSSETRLVTYSGPSRALIFPAGVGDQWVDAYDQVEGGVLTEIVAENEIVAYNTLQVPAGEFDAFLLQTRVTATTDGDSVSTWDYVWLVPGIGRAAEIVSDPGEEDEVFDRAYAFYRLESQENA